LDRFLGQGSAQTLGRAVGGALAAARRPAAAAPKPDLLRRAQPGFRARHLQAVGAGEGAHGRGRKGVIRGLLLLLGLAWAAFMLKPWQAAGELRVDLAALFKRPPAASAPQASSAGKAQAQRDQAEAAHLEGLPIIPGRGEALALWQGPSGRWYRVDAHGLLSPGEAPGQRGSLGLVQLRGIQAASEPHGQGRRLRLRLPSGLLKELLPLKAGVSSEAQALLLDDPAEPVILTHDGARSLLSRQGWERQQERLALVLADLAARKRRAELIDLRYDDSAVVRPAGR
jgi:hypothetical protein